MQIHTNSYVVARQTADSELSFFDGEWDEIVARTVAAFDQATPGYREGVVLVPIDPTGCFSGVATLSYDADSKEGSKLFGEYTPRREGETPRKTLRATGATKIAAKGCEIVLYASTVLAEEGSNELPAEEGNWEIISLNASPTEGTMPIHPDTLMHNHFGSDGGSATGLSSADFEAMLKVSFEYWKDKAMAG